MKRAASKPAAKKAEPTDEERRAALVIRSRENPHEFFSFEDCGIILGFGTKAMGRLNGAGAPVAFRKMNPALICQWIAQNPSVVAKIGSPEGEE